MWETGTVVTPEQCVNQTETQASAPIENPPLYAPLTKKAETDPPAWVDSQWVKEKKGLYSVLKGTFEVDVKEAEEAVEPAESKRQVKRLAKVWSPGLLLGEGTSAGPTYKEDDDGRNKESVDWAED